MMQEFKEYPPNGRILGPVNTLETVLKGKTCPVKRADTDLFYLGTWQHMHSPEMLLALATLARELLKDGEELIGVSRANFSTLVTGNLRLFAARNVRLTPNLLGLSDGKKLAGEFATNSGDFVHVIGVTNDTRVEKHTAFNPLVPALSAGFDGRTREGNTLKFPITPNKVAAKIASSKVPSIGLATAHELLIRTWYHGLRELLPNGGFAWQVNYSSIPTVTQLFACDELALGSGNWEGIALRDGFKVVDVNFVFSQNARPVSSGTYRHLHPNSKEEREATLRNAGIISS